MCAMETPTRQVVGLATHRRSGDRRQAEYYRRLLEIQRAQIYEELVGHAATLTRYHQAGDLPGVRRLRRLVRAKESELVTLERLINGLDRRFGLPEQAPAPAPRT